MKEKIKWNQVENNKHKQKGRKEGRKERGGEKNKLGVTLLALSPHVVIPLRPAATEQ